MESVYNDLRLSLRAFRKNPGFAMLAILALALGIGANTAIFSIVYSMMFRPLPGATNPEELVSLVLTEGKRYPYATSYAAFRDYAAIKDVFSGAAGFMSTDARLRIGNGVPERIMPTVVTGDFFQVLGVPMRLGRPFQGAEIHQIGAGNVAVLSYRFWQTRFHGDRDAVGTVIFLNGNAFTIVGVCAREFHGTSTLLGQSVYVPITGVDLIYPGLSRTLEKRGNGEFHFIGRLRPGIDLDTARAAVNVVAARLEQEYPDVHKGQRALLYPEPRTRMEPAAANFMPPIAVLFMTLVGLVLLAACSNVASLLYARAAGRQKEVAIRMSLGAGRGRILQQLLIESLLLSFLGAAAGILLAHEATTLLSGIHVATDLPIEFDIVIDRRVIGYVLVLAVSSGLLAGIIPGLRTSRTDLTSNLKEGGQASIGGAVRQRLRDALVVVQVAVSLVLLVCAGLFLQSTIHASHQDLGVKTDGRLVMTMDTDLAGYDETRSRTFYRQLLQRVRGLPGVESAAYANNLPLGFRNRIEKVFIDGEADQGNRTDSIFLNAVSDNYFETVGMPILQGRTFTQSDVAGSKRVAIVNLAMAERYWPGRNPLGKKIHTGSANADPLEVVGVAKTAKNVLPAESPTPAFYVPFDQNYSSYTILHVHTRDDPEQMIEVVRSEILQLDPEMPVWGARTMEEHIRYGKLRLYDVGTGLIGGFGLIALALSAVGLFGVISFLVQQQRRDIGVRMALGASRPGVLKMILARGMRKTVLGLLVGAPLAVLAARSINYLLVGVSPRDPGTLFLACAFLVGITLASSLVPAWRASRLDPAVALRAE